MANNLVFSGAAVDYICSIRAIYNTAQSKPLIYGKKLHEITQAMREIPNYIVSFWSQIIVAKRRTSCSKKPS
ncbi:uncharacterized protein ASCRUDRAFT_76156 [Ascoidea rubescens DSM 1968]|uniref:Uncharacterized protein n=1 Tax=Ascoidea rubescens DSM 1968 TaxID=1344418 RepID=A0A1D2VGJ6_9ASCO|nr:hypothetical protein ASCRUDRAFT_76156 [Ascoidea rubescens DSM 1968]ODV60791.1 hypothetical protein ASCRUDRAFT_76156 [Ascoidea rubescens DSM 1968]